MDLSCPEVLSSRPVCRAIEKAYGKKPRWFLDLKVTERFFIDDSVDCPKCGQNSPRHSFGTCWLRHHDAAFGACAVLRVYSKHHCESCSRYFNNPAASGVFENHVRYTHAFMEWLKIMRESGLTYEAISKRLERGGMHAPTSSVSDWLKPH